MGIVRLPYEILVRFSDTGSVQGCHYVERVVVTDDAGVQVTNQVQGPQPVSLTGTAGLVIQKVLGDALAQALVTVEQLKAKIQALEPAPAPPLLTAKKG